MNVCLPKQVKRNTELQYEAMQAYKEYAGLSLSMGEGQTDELSQLPNPDELERMLDDRVDEEEEALRSLQGGDYDPEKVRG